MRCWQVGARGDRPPSSPTLWEALLPSVARQIELGSGVRFVQWPWTREVMWLVERQSLSFLSRFHPNWEPSPASPPASLSTHSAHTGGRSPGTHFLLRRDFLGSASATLSEATVEVTHLGSGATLPDGSSQRPLSWPFPGRPAQGGAEVSRPLWDSEDLKK